MLLSWNIKILVIDNFILIISLYKKDYNNKLIYVFHFLFFNSFFDRYPNRLSILWETISWNSTMIIWFKNIIWIVFIIESDFYFIFINNNELINFHVNIKYWQCIKILSSILILIFFSSKLFFFFFFFFFFLMFTYSLID